MYVLNEVTAVLIELLNCIIIPFHTVAESVLANAKSSGIYFNNSNFEVVKYIPPPKDPLKMLVKGISKTTTNETLSLFLETRCNVCPKEITRGKSPSTAMLHFTSAPGYEILIVLKFSTLFILCAVFHSALNIEPVCFVSNMYFFFEHIFI